MTYEIIITKEYDGVKPKNFLKKNLDLSFNQLLKHLKDKRITLNKKKIKEDSIFKKGDIIKIWLDEIKLRDESLITVNENNEKKTKNISNNLKTKQENNKGKISKKHYKSKNLNIKTIFENNEFIVLNKTSGVIVQGAQDNDESISLHLAYLQKENNDINNDFEYHHVHRLDKETSGTLLIAKNRISLRNLNKVFHDKLVKKKYICLCIGKFKNKADKIEIHLKRNPEGIREKVTVSKDNLNNTAKKTLSNYKVLKEYNFENQGYSLVEVEIKTGFTHQIRVHMKYLGNPIVGDKMYGNSIINKKFEKILNRQFLHAKSLEFQYEDENENKNYKFEAELSKELEDTLKLIEK